MFRGSNVVLRSRLESDVPILHRDLYEDVPTRVRTEESPWRPLSPDASPFKPKPADAPNRDRVSVFTAADPSTDETPRQLSAVGYRSLQPFGRTSAWRFARSPGARAWAGRPRQLLCQYGFQILGLNRIGIETLTDKRSDDPGRARSRVQPRRDLASGGLGQRRAARRSYFRVARCRMASRAIAWRGTRHRCRASSSRIVGGTGRCLLLSADT